MRRAPALALAASLAGAALLQSVGAPVAAAPAAPPVRVTLDGQPVQVTPPPVVVDGQAYVSAAAISRLLGVPASWDARTHTLRIGLASQSAHSFTFEGVRYAVAGLLARTFTGPQSTSGLYWVVRYALTNTTGQDVDVPQSQPSLVLLGPRGAQYTPDASLSGQTAGTLNPGITFSSYAVFNVPAGAKPSAYALGFDAFDAYGSTAHGFQRAPLGAVLTPSIARTTATRVGATYTVSNLWNSDAQQVLIRQVVRSSAILPDLTATSFVPTTTVWIVDVSVSNPGSQDITLQPADFALQFGGEASVSPYPVVDLPGYVPDSGLYAPPGSSSSGSSGAASGAGTEPQPQTVSVAPGQVWTGALLFEVPGTIATRNPSLEINVNGQTRVVSVAPCPRGGCPPAQE